MKQMFSRIIFMLRAAIVALIVALAVQAQTAPDTNDLTTLLKEFLTGASRNDAAVHDRFWAEDVIYTGSAGRRRGKADIMRDVRSAPAPQPGDPTTVYSAEDIRIQQYGNTAVVAFRLVGSVTKTGGTQVTNYLNSGTFLKRNGKWQVVSWQSTRMPRPEEEARREVAATEAAFHQAVLAADVKKLEALTDPSFIWTHHTGEQMTRRQWLDELGSGRLKYSRLDTNNVVVSVYGDTGVVRGVSPRQRSSLPASPGSGDATPFNAFYTLTFVYKDGAWKAVAMHSSRP
jgi:ketosteroid isomerase-like protein